MPRVVDQLYYELSARESPAADRAADAFKRKQRQHGEEAGREFGQGIEAALAREFDKGTAKEFAESFSKEFKRGLKIDISETDTKDLFARTEKNLAGVGERGGEAAKQGFAEQLRGLPGLIRGGIAVGIIAAFTYIANQVTRIFRSIATTINDIFQRAGFADQIRQAFEVLSGTQGLNVTTTLASLRQATRGLVRDTELLRQANFALQAGLPVTEKSLASLAEGSRRLARALGRDAADAFQRLTESVVKGERRLLDELGIVVSFEDAYKKFADAVGRSTDSLDAQERLQIRLDAVTASLVSRVKQLGTETLTAGEHMKQLTTFMANLGDAAATAVTRVPQVERLLNAIGGAAEGNADKVQDFADTLQAMLTVIAAAIEQSGKGAGAQVVGGAGGFLGGLLGRAVGVPDITEQIAKEKARIKVEREIAENLAEQARLLKEIDKLQLAQQTLEPLVVNVRTTAEIKKAAAATAELAEATRKLNEQQAIADRLGISRFQIPPEANQQLERRTQLLAEIARLEALRAAGGVGAEKPLAAAREELEGVDAALEKVVTKAEATLARINAEAPPAIASIGELSRTIAIGIVRTLSPVSVSVQDAVQAVLDAESELTAALLAGDAKRSESARRALAARRADAEEVAKRIAIQLEASGVHGERLNAIIAQITAALREAGIEVGEISDNLGDAASRIISVARGILSAADAAGVASENTRRWLDSIIGIAQGIQTISKASGSLDKLVGAVQLGGSILQLGRALLGGSDDAAANDAARQREEELRRNTDALGQLVKSIEDLSAAIGPLTSQVQAAIDRAFDLIQRALPGAPVSRPTTIAETRESFREARGFAKGGDVETIRIINEAAIAFEKFVEKLQEDVNRELDLRELQLTGNQRLIEAEKQRIAQEKELRDAQEAGLDEGTIRRIKVVQARERQAREEQEAEAEKRAIEDAQVRQLEAQGFSQTAAFRRLALQQERELAEARKRGASEAEIAALKETQLAEKRAAVESFINDIVRSAAVRRGDTATVVALDQANVLKAFSDAHKALEELRDSGSITSEKFDELSQILDDELGPALEAVGAAAKQAADDFKEGIDVQIEDLLDPAGAEERRIRRQADVFREQAKTLFTGTELENVLKSIDRWLELSLSGLTGDAATALGGAVGPTEATKSVTRITETQAQTLVDFTRESLFELQRQTPILSDILRELRQRNVFSSAPSDPFSGGGGRGDVNIRDIIVNLSGTEATAQAGQQVVQSITNQIATIDRALLDRALDTTQGGGGIALPPAGVGSIVFPV